MEEREYGHLYYENNKEKMKEKSKKYYEANKELIKKKKKAYNQANRERINAYQRAYYRAHKVDFDEAEKKRRSEYTKWLLNQELNKNNVHGETVTEHQ